MTRMHEASAAAEGAAADARSERRNGWKLFFGGRLTVRRAGEREALLLALLCALDTYTTLFWVVTGHAVEANPLLAWTFSIHPMAFVIVKCASCIPALYFAPRLAQTRPLFTIWLLRTILFAYIGLYLFHVK